MKSLRILCLIFLVLAVSCTMKPKGRWEEGIIAVMADSTDWLLTERAMEGAFEHLVRTPQLEKTFALRYVPVREMNRYVDFRYLVLLGTLGSTGRIGELVKGVVSDPEIRRRVEQGEYFYFIQTNQWAKDQLMLILVARDMESLVSRIEGNGTLLHEIFLADMKERILEDTYYRGEQKEIEEKLMRMYGWSIRLQRDFFVAQEFSEEGFVWFRRMYPERWIFVRWIDGGDTTLLNQQWMLNERNRIGGAYYSGDRVVGNYLFSYRTTFLNRPALLTTGLWENDGKVAGGPFRNYLFYDELSRRVYMIDVAVFSPGEDKMPYLHRLDVIAGTFKTLFDSEVKK